VPCGASYAPLPPPSPPPATPAQSGRRRLLTAPARPLARVARPQFVFHPPSLGDAQKRKGLTLLASMSGLTQLFAEDTTIPVFTPAGVVVNAVMPGLVATSASSKPAKDGSDVQLTPIETASTEESPTQPESAAPAPADVAAAALAPAPAAAPPPAKLGPAADDEPPVPPSPSEVAVALLATNTLTEPDEQPRPGRQPRWSELDLPVPDGKPLVEVNVVPFSVVRGGQRRAIASNCRRPLTAVRHRCARLTPSGRVVQVKQDIKDTVLSIIHSGSKDAAPSGPDVTALELSVLGVVLVQELLATVR